MIDSETGLLDTNLVLEWDLDGYGVFGESGNQALNGDEVGANATFKAGTLDGWSHWSDFDDFFRHNRFGSRSSSQCYL